MIQRAIHVPLGLTKRCRIGGSWRESCNWRIEDFLLLQMKIWFFATPNEDKEGSSVKTRAYERPAYIIWHRRTLNCRKWCLRSLFKNYGGQQRRSSLIQGIQMLPLLMWPYLLSHLHMKKHQKVLNGVRRWRKKLRH